MHLIDLGYRDLSLLFHFVHRTSCPGPIMPSPGLESPVPSINLDPRCFTTMEGGRKLSHSDHLRIAFVS